MDDEGGWNGRIIQNTPTDGLCFGSLDDEGGFRGVASVGWGENHPRKQFIVQNSDDKIDRVGDGSATFNRGVRGSTERWKKSY